MGKARPSIRLRRERDAKARATLARRARRERFFREWKKTITMALVGLLVLVIVLLYFLQQ